MAYSDKVVDHYENPRNVGTFDKSDPGVGTGLVTLCVGAGMGTATIIERV